MGPGEVSRGCRRVTKLVQVKLILDDLDPQFRHPDQQLILDDLMEISDRRDLQTEKD